VFLQTGLTPLQVAREIVEVIDPGQVTLLVRCPSLGRYRYGLAPGGPFDVEAAMSANRAAGNAPDAPLLECTLVGPTLRFHEPLILSWYGAEARIRIEGSMVETPYQFRVEAGQTLEVGALVRGARGWLALQGGLLDPAPRHVIFPTRVAAGQIIHVQRASDATARIKNLVRESPLLIRALPGPHPIDPRLLEQIAERAWRVTPILDRTGIRLESERLSYEPPSLLPSCPMQFGTVQWHPNGELVIMGPDHPVTGGYLQVLTVLSSELWKLAQLRPGDEIRWEIGGGGDGRGKRI
ncbi:MAG TPA: biotin-dependent carboxyltransferase family protein, partial [Thermoanaerobaculia bacterium]|nr:biotin-dependent carboxyltransferase family protein [Thermoanaerobaculia bacterium]